LLSPRAPLPSFFIPGSYIISFNENVTKQDVGSFEPESVKIEKISKNVNDTSKKIKDTSDRISQGRGKVPFVYDKTGYGMNIQNVKGNEILAIAAQYKDDIADISPDILDQLDRQAMPFHANRHDADIITSNSVGKPDNRESRPDIDVAVFDQLVWPGVSSSVRSHPDLVVNYSIN
jgi:hypothetical protein